MPDYRHRADQKDHESKENRRDIAKPGSWDPDVREGVGVDGGCGWFLAGVVTAVRLPILRVSRGS